MLSVRHLGVVAMCICAAGHAFAVDCPPDAEARNRLASLFRDSIRCTQGVSCSVNAENYEREAARLIGACDSATAAALKLELEKTWRSEMSGTKRDIMREIAATGQTAFTNVNRFWVLLSAVLVFFMQAGFKSLEVGMARSQHGASQAAMKLISWTTACLFYFAAGFGIMFGYQMYFPDVAALKAANPDFRLEFFLFQLAFAGTAVTIVSGAMAERTKLAACFVVAIVVALVIYPIVGNMAWRGSACDADCLKKKCVARQVAAEEKVPNFDPAKSKANETCEVAAKADPHQGEGWLQRRGFRDFAGSTVVHSVGGWVALMAAVFVGPRRGRFNPNGTPNKNNFRSDSVGYAILGVFMLWFGWWGFNGGSQLRYDDSIADIILNTNLAGAAAGLIGLLSAHWRWLRQLTWPLYAAGRDIAGAVFRNQGRLEEHEKQYAYLQENNRYEKFIGAILGGLVAITASCNIVTPQVAILIGFIAGIVHNIAFDILLLAEIDDPVGAFPVHGACGVLGTLLVTLGNTGMTFFDQLLIQSAGVAITFLVATLIACLPFEVLRIGGWLRVSPAEEDSGY